MLIYYSAFALIFGRQVYKKKAESIKTGHGIDW
jgi:hypothetical protein